MILICLHVCLSVCLCVCVCLSPSHIFYHDGCPTLPTHLRPPFTKPPLFRRNRLTGGGNPTFESYVEGKALKREIEVYCRSSFQIPHDCTHFIEAQLIRTGLVLWSPSGGSQCTQKFPAVRFSLYTTFKKRNCLRILAHTFGIGLLLLMHQSRKLHQTNYKGITILAG